MANVMSDQQIYEDGINLLCEIKERYEDEESYKKIIMNLKNVLNELHAIRVKNIVGQLNSEEWTPPQSSEKK